MFAQLLRKKSKESILAEIPPVEAGLRRILGVRELTMFGVAAIIGAGIFGTIGNAAASGGPAVTLLFVFTAIACGLAAWCYAAFASLVPVAGSVYAYSYLVFGELVAWMLGWTLVMEYGVGNVAIAVSWSDYLTVFLKGLGWEIPPHFGMDYLSAWRGAAEFEQLTAAGKPIPAAVLEARTAWLGAPQLAGFRLIADLPALLIIAVTTLLLYVGIRESSIAGKITVAIKLFITTMFLAIGVFYVQPANWVPFAPNGFSGVTGGVAGVFFAYIGFDAISSMAEESREPRRDIPRAIFYSLGICAALYIAIALVLTGMVHYSELAVGDPLAFAFKKTGLHWVSGVIAFSAVVAIASVFLTCQVVVPRVLMTMSRDGLLPTAFARVHPRFRTPGFSTLVGAVLVAVPALFMNLKALVDLSAFAALFCFVVVCAGVMELHRGETAAQMSVGMPLWPAKYVLLVGVLVGGFVFHQRFPAEWSAFFSTDGFLGRLPRWIFLLTTLGLTVLSFFKHYSLVPVLGVLTSLYLMSELDLGNWTGFFLWLGAGLILYGLYGFWHSRLRETR
ncbi:MAG: amino acid permease [Verrucomicrobia bacterium]|nr:amino acid permease [Verrucomicrobiota bacterium]